MIENQGIYNATQEYRMEAMLEKYPRLSGTLKVVRSMLMDVARENEELDISASELAPTDLEWDSHKIGVGLGWRGWYPPSYETYRSGEVRRSSDFEAHAGVLAVFDQPKFALTPDIKIDEPVKLIVYSSVNDARVIQVNKSYGEELRVIPAEFAKNPNLQKKIEKANNRRIATSFDRQRFCGI